MKKRMYITAVLSTAFSMSQTFAMAPVPQQQEIQRKLELVQYFKPIMQLAPRVKLHLLFALLQQIQEKDIDQLVAMHKTNGTMQNADLIKKLLLDLKQQAAQASKSLDSPVATLPLQQRMKGLLTNIKTRVNQALTTVTQRLRPEERVGLILALAHALPPTTLQTATISNAVKSILSQLSAQASALKQTVQNKFAPHLKEEIAKHEQEVIKQTEADTV